MLEEPFLNKVLLLKLHRSKEVSYLAWAREDVILIAVATCSIGHQNDELAALPSALLVSSRSFSW